MIGRLTSNTTTQRAARLFAVGLIVGGLAAFTCARATTAESAVRSPAAAAVIDKLAGTWRLQSSVIRDQSGAVIGPLYEDNAGKLTYTRRGEMWAVVGNRGSQLWYTGRFEVRPKINTVVHHVQYSTEPSYEGTDLIRRYRFLGENVLRLRAAVGPNTLELIWKRA